MMAWSSFTAWRDMGLIQPVVATNGCFDILHAGHVKMLQEARKMGRYLVVGLNSDESVRALKGPARPVNSAVNRAIVLDALECVNHVVVFNGTRCPDFLQLARPDVYVKAGDYTLDTLDPGEKAVLDELGTEIKFTDLKPGISTTNILARADGRAERNPPDRK